MSRRYFPPVPHHTGSLLSQPRAAVTRSELYVQFSRREVVLLHEFINGSLDAPELIPSGGVRASDIGALTLGIDHLERAQ